MNFDLRSDMIGCMSPMDMSKFAIITKTDELLRLKEVYKVIFVPYRPEVLNELLEITPDKKSGKRKFTQARFAEECGVVAREFGYEKKQTISQKTVSSYCRGEFMPDASALEIMGKVLGVFFVPGLDRQADARQILDYIKGLHS